MAQNVANGIYCPVCKNCYDEHHDVCPVCGFDEAGKIFVTIEDGDQWMAETVLAYKICWLNRRERETERREKLLHEKEKELDKREQSSSDWLNRRERELARRERILDEKEKRLDNRNSVARGNVPITEYHTRQYRSNDPIIQYNTMQYLENVRQLKKARGRSDND